MKILHVIPAISPVYGGPSSNILPLCEAFLKLGNDVTIVTTNANGKFPPLKREDVSSDCEILIFSKSFSESWKFSLKFMKWIEKNCNNFDIICTHAVWSFLPYYAGRVAVKKHVPLVVRPAGMLSPYTFSHKKILKSFFWRFFDGNVIKTANAFHATSSGEEKEIRFLRPDADVFVVPHGLDDVAFEIKVDPNWLRNKFLKGFNEPILLFLSRLHPKKGICDLLLPALTKVKTKFKLLIAGGADPHVPNHGTDIQKRIHELKLSDKVKMIGPISSRDRWAAYDGADLFVLPSQSENFGVVVTEAMARGLPVLVSDEVQIQDIVLENSAGWVIARDIDLWANALDSALKNLPPRKPRYQMRWDTVANTLLAHYEEVISSFCSGGT